MFKSNRHPGDDALVRWYMADRGLGALEPTDETVVRHVSGCVRCAARYHSVCTNLDATAAEAVAAADAAFPPDRLLLQRERILRRLDAAGARVLPFPTGDATSARSATSRPMLRWIAVAAAAGLLIGLVGGRLLLPSGETAPTVASRTIPAGGGAQVRPAILAGTAREDAFLSDVEMALSAPRTPELEPIDVMTLQVRTTPPPK